MPHPSRLYGQAGTCEPRALSAPRRAPTLLSLAPRREITLRPRTLSIALLILFTLVLISLVLIPFGLPGLWLMILSALGYLLLLPGSIGWGTLAGATLLGVVAEVLEFTLAGKYTRNYGGSPRATWGAILGGLAGAIIGVPVPILGSIIGAFVGSFAGALIAELTRGSSSGTAMRAAKGALIGRAIAAAMKCAFGIAIAVWVIWDAWV
jgi:uncharacterized protein YqgC (DUF456 family)